MNDENSRVKFLNVFENSSGLGNELIAPQPPVIGTGQIKCRERLGGLLKFDEREAA